MKLWFDGIKLLITFYKFKMCFHAGKTKCLTLNISSFCFSFWNQMEQPNLISYPKKKKSQFIPLFNSLRQISLILTSC